MLVENLFRAADAVCMSGGSRVRTPQSPYEAVGVVSEAAAFTFEVKGRLPGWNEDPILPSQERGQPGFAATPREAFRTCFMT